MGTFLSVATAAIDDVWPRWAARQNVGWGVRLGKVLRGGCHVAVKLFLGEGGVVCCTIVR